MSIDPTPEEAKIIRRESTVRVVDWILKGSTALVLVVVSFIGQDLRSTLERLEARLSSQERLMAGIQASRFTAADGVKMQAEMSRLWQELAKYPQRSEVPPDWFRKHVETLGDSLRSLEERVRAVEKAQK